ncbi:MAG: DUF2779 domain-containing protein [Gemmatimonadales bacterium]
MPAPRTLSKSDFKLACDCPSKLYYREMGYPDTNTHDPYLRLLAFGGYMVEALARLEYPEGIAIEQGGNHVAAAAETLERLAAGDVTLFNATFLHEGYLARADILRKRGRVIDLIEVKSGTIDETEAADRLQKTGSPFRQLRKAKGAATYPIHSDWTRYLLDAAYQVFVARQVLPGFEVRAHLVLVRSEHRTTIEGLPAWFEFEERPARDGAMRIREVRFTGDAEAARRDSLTVTYEVTAEVEELLPEIARDAGHFLASLLPEPARLAAPLSGACRDCEFRTDTAPSGFHECWGARAAVRPSVLELYKGGAKTDEFISEGISSLLDVPVDRLRRKDGALGVIGERQLIQIRHTQDDLPWQDPALTAALSAATWPLHFVDFEVAKNAIPHHRGMSPYGQLAFQWSCHTLRAPGGALEHREWLNTDRVWPNVAFARSLREAVGEEGTILTWSAFERTTLVTVADELTRFAVDDPGLGAWLLRVTGTKEVPGARLLDLHDLCRRYYFHPRMGGRTSIKVVLDALWAASPRMRARFAELEGREGDPSLGPYAALPPATINGTPVEVAEGTGAIRAYEAMVYGLERNDELARTTWSQLLRQYCRLDTLAMVLIWEHWMASG